VHELRLKVASTPITKVCLNPDSIRRSMFAYGSRLPPKIGSRRLQSG